MGEGPSDERLAELVTLRRVKDRIDRDHAEPLDVEALARAANMSAGHLSRRFRAAFGESPYGYLMTRRIERAMALLTDDERRTLAEIIAKGSYFGVNLATPDLDATFAQLEAGGAEIVQEPVDQDDGLRDCAVRDPAGNMLRIQQTPTT